MRNNAFHCPIPRLQCVFHIARATSKNENCQFKMQQVRMDAEKMAQKSATIIYENIARCSGDFHR